jgi:multidrug efflux pump subunit AcrA (membrane-fusion protein)
VGELTRTAGANVEPHYLICPSCQAKLVQQMDGELALPEPAADQAIKPSVRAKARTELAKAQVQLTAARNAAARLAEPPPALPRPTEEQMTKAKDEVAQAADFLAGLRKQQEAYAAAAQARIEHDRRLENAKTEHLWVGGWTKAQEALSPNGIPSELMAQAMGPMRAAIKEACASEYVRDWPLPELADDGGISAWGRPYPLLSESEQYRVDAILTTALAKLSGVRMIAMDRADVLTPQVRSELIGWLADMSDDGALEQAWCFSSMKGRPDPAALAELDVDGYWVENGALHG